MARTAVALTVLVVNSSLADPAGTTIDSTLVTAGVNVPLASTAIPVAKDMTNGILIRVKNTDSGSAHVVTLRAGSNPPSFRADLGDLTMSVALSATRWFGPFDSSRFIQQGNGSDVAKQSLNIDFDSGTTGTITVFVLPRTA